MTTDTAGFDILTSVSQDTINYQFSQLFKQSVIPNQIDANVSGTATSIQAELGPPLAVLAGSPTALAVSFHLLLPSGTLVYVDSSGTAQSMPITNWTYVFTVGLNLVAVGQSDIQNNAAIPAAVQQTLASFSDEAFTIQHLLLDFESADVSAYDAQESTLPQPDGSPLTADQLSQFQQALAAYFATLTGAENPFVLGYSAANKQAAVDGADNALFAVTGSAVSVFDAAPSPGDNTLNFLLMTAERAVPPVPPNGQLTASPISSSNYDGAMAIAPDLFVNAYLENTVLPIVASAAQLGPFVRGGNEWITSYETDNSSENSGWGKVVVQSAALNLYELSQTVRTASAILTTGATPTITINGEFFVSATFNEYPADIALFVGSAVSTLKWTVAIVISAGTDGTIAVTATYDEHGGPQQRTQEGTVFSAVEKIFPIGNSFESFLAGLAQDGASVQEADFTTMANRLQADLQSLGQRVILPAGDVFFISDATLLDDFGLHFDIQYKASH